jgi:hypothetical protein
MPSASKSRNSLSKTLNAVIDRLPEDSAEPFRRLLETPVLDAGDLWMMVREHLVVLREADADEEMLDGKLGVALAEASEALLNRFPDEDSEDAKLLIQAAVRYFVLNEDAEGDLDSLVGFDDDAMVFNAVVEELGHEDLVVDL